MKEVEELLTRLEAAEALYPSSQAMGAFHPIYKSAAFVGRIKTMCLWYNITQQARLKLTILGKILARLQGEKFSWPVQTSYTATETMGSASSSSASGLENEIDSGVHSVDSTKSYQRKQSVVAPSNGGIACPKVQFLLNDEVAHVHAGEQGDTTSSNEYVELVLNITILIICETIFAVHLPQNYARLQIICHIARIPYTI